MKENFCWHGPVWETAGNDCQSISNGIFEALQPILDANPNETINLVGHSRGGYIVMEVARELQKRGYRVNFLGLYDAVDMAPGFGEAETIPSNVDHAAHAMANPWVGSRPLFNRADHGPEDRSKMKGCHIKLFRATHAGMGGAPWYGDHPSGMTKEVDQLQSSSVDYWMRWIAKEKARIKFALTPPLPPPSGYSGDKAP